MRTKCCFSVVGDTMSRTTGTIMAPPMPWNTRAAVNCHSVPLAEHSTDDNVNATIAEANTVRAPNRSVTQPLAGMNTATVSRYADIPMLRSTAATSNDCAIWGSAVAITVPSSCSMNNAPATRSAITALCRRDLSMVDSATTPTWHTYKSWRCCEPALLHRNPPLDSPLEAGNGE